MGTESGTDTPLRALIIEDSEDDTLLLVHHLSEGGFQMDWRRVDAREPLLSALETEEWDIVFADYSMPNFSGTEALALLREKDPDLPFIFVSGTIGESTAVAAMKGGAHDYIMKDNLHRLLPAVERELHEARGRRDQRRAERESQLLQTITQAASDAVDMGAALTVSIAKICETAGWPLGQAWIPNADGTAIECSSAWWCRGGGLEPFRTASQGLVFAPGEGLPGRVWTSRQPAWQPDPARDDGAPRAALARDAGLGAACGLPVLAGEDVLAVLEFFLFAPGEEDERMMRIASAATVQLGSVLQRKRAEKRLHYLAYYDPVTGLPNRTLFIDRLEQAMREARRRGRIVGVAFLDLDRFKTINDSLGHEIGDLLLGAVAGRLSRNVRESDTVARLAGDEFMLILADMGHADHAGQVARKILDSLAEPIRAGGHELYIGASVGIALYPLDAEDTEGLMRNADLAMYRAKERGGNLYEFYATEMTARAQVRLEREYALRRALDRREFLLHYQPIVDLRSERTIAVEALVRWLDPERGPVPPGELIQVAEETDHIVALGEWVMHEVGRECQRHGDGPGPLRFAVNISPRQIQAGKFFATITRALEETGMDPGRLDLEITETLLMQNAEGVRKAMQELGERGVRFSVDDFGTGYSSLSYLKHLPISQVKIDSVFVRDVPADDSDAAIVVAIISMAHSLGLTVVAEGVETEEQLAFLREHGCDAAQGYLFNPPMPGDALR